MAASVTTGRVAHATPGAPRAASYTNRWDTAYEIDTTTEMVSFAHPPDAGVQISTGFEFDVPVRFASNRIETSLASFQAGDAPSVPVVEVRV